MCPTAAGCQRCRSVLRFCTHDDQRRFDTEADVEYLEAEVHASPELPKPFMSTVSMKSSDAQERTFQVCIPVVSGIKTRFKRGCFSRSSSL